MKCWKCGAETDGVMECEACEQAAFASATTQTPATCGVVHTIDWDKVHTLAEVKEILTAFGFQVRGGPGTEPHDTLKRFFLD